MTIKFLPVIIGLSVSVAVTSTFASHLTREEDELQQAIAASRETGPSIINEDDELQRVLELSLNDYRHIEDEVDSSALALQIAHDEEERRNEIEAQERLVREFEEKRARAEEEELQRILALSMDDTVNNASSNNVNLDEQDDELARQLAKAFALSLTKIPDEEVEGNPGRTLIEQQNLEYQATLLTDQLRGMRRDLQLAEENLDVLKQPFVEKEAEIEALKRVADDRRNHAAANEKRFGQNPRLEAAALEAEEAVVAAEEALRLLEEENADQMNELKESIAELSHGIEEKEMALVEVSAELANL
ncbi:MAG: hypothetical protein GW748_06925 [Alphaproteobacteria bacterium]|nr:hypothetical protein [Alphaproteobacteria bacterium]NCQ67461.1 hypothetical protein [Alphaproteobacteria bacterium]NCT08080.1 hypothetical protein [Alphaproteobacteria bacterium]